MRDQPVHVLIVDDNAMLRDGLRFALGTCEDVLVIGEAEDGEEAIALCEQLLPDVVLMDLNMPGMDGVTATRISVRNSPTFKWSCSVIHPTHRG